MRITKKYAIETVQKAFGFMWSDVDYHGSEEDDGEILCIAVEAIEDRMGVNLKDAYIEKITKENERLQRELEDLELQFIRKEVEIHVWDASNGCTKRLEVEQISQRNGKTIIFGEARWRVEE